MIYIVAIEPIDTRYTGHWFDYVPKQIAENTKEEVTQIIGDLNSNTVTEGAFLDFSFTNIWKNTQASKIAKLFSENKIQPNDYFLFMDAWNPTAIEIKYMADLFETPIKIGGIWHAGSYDPYDFLGRKIKNKSWSYATERALYEVYDHNYFATDYHIKLLESTLDVSGKSYRIGFPMEYYSDLTDVTSGVKKNQIVFPHRISEEKQPELFKSLKDQLPEFDFIVCQEQNLTKKEYHKILSESKIVFSANLQETLGIGVFEGMLSGAIPLVPDRLSYVEMYYIQFKYNDKNIVDKIKDMIYNYTSYQTIMALNTAFIMKNYFTGTILYDTIRNR